MKKLLNIISWICFSLAVVAAVSAVLCSIAGTLLLVSAVFVSGLLNIVLYCAIGYFGSLIVLALFYIIFCLHQAVERAARKHE